MRISNHICFPTENHSDVTNFLLQAEIPFDENYGLAVLDIFEDHPHWKELSFYVKQYDLFCTSQTLFSKEDLDTAEWMIVWSRWRCGYPQPEGEFTSKNYTYDHTQRCDNCGFGEFQIAPFRIKKAPKWGQRNFTELFWIDDELFLSEKAKRTIEDMSIPGISFEDVFSKSGAEKLEGVYQLVVSNILPAGLIEEQSALKKTEICPICGQKRHLNNGRGMDTYRKEIFINAPDIVKTGDIFGAEFNSIRRIIVSQRVYKILLENKLDKDLGFEPIKLV